MTDIAFQAISEAIKARLDTAFANRVPLPEVVLEQEFEPRESWVVIYCQGVQAPEDDQPLTASRKQRLQVRFEIWCWRFAMTNTQAAELRDALVGDVELALMLDRTLNGTVDTSWLEGGRFNRAEDPQSLGRFFCGGEVVLVCDVMASNI
jgi:hypothetical protein